MSTFTQRASGRFAIAAVAALALVACTDEPPTAVDSDIAAVSRTAAVRVDRDVRRAVVQMREATARYHNVETAIEDEFVLVHPCENRPGEGPVGVLYANISRIMDGVLDPRRPDGLIYAPTREGRLKLVGAELAMPYALWSGAQPPTFLGVPLQPEDEFGVYGLHVWVWGENPNGMFAQSNPRVSCDVDP